VQGNQLEKAAGLAVLLERRLESGSEGADAEQ
jgi:hypothetical protein